MAEPSMLEVLFMCFAMPCSLILGIALPIILVIKLSRKLGGE